MKPLKKSFNKSVLLTLLYGIIIPLCYFIAFSISKDNSLILLAGVFMIIMITALFQFGYYLIQTVGYLIGTSITWGQYNRNELEAEISQADTVYFEKAKLFVTNRHLIYSRYGISVLPIDSIGWIYGGHPNTIFIRKRAFIYINTLDGQKCKTPNIFSNKYQQVNAEIMEEIFRKNSNILVGFTFENKTQYEDMIKK